MGDAENDDDNEDEDSFQDAVDDSSCLSIDRTPGQRSSSASHTAHDLSVIAVRLDWSAADCDSSTIVDSGKCVCMCLHACECMCCDCVCMSVMSVCVGFCMCVMSVCVYVPVCA